MKEKNRTGNSQARLASYEIKLCFANDMPQLPSLKTWRKATVLRVAINGNRIKETQHPPWPGC